MPFIAHHVSVPVGRPEGPLNLGLSASLDPTAYYAVDPSNPKFQIGFCWYPGIRPETALMHNKTYMGDTSPANINLVPPSIPRFSLSPRRSVNAGARDNSQFGYPMVTTRIVMPQVRRW